MMVACDTLVAVRRSGEDAMVCTFDMFQSANSDDVETIEGARAAIERGETFMTGGGAIPLCEIAAATSQDIINAAPDLSDLHDAIGRVIRAGDVFRQAFPQAGPGEESAEYEAYSKAYAELRQMHVIAEAWVAAAFGGSNA